MTSQGRNYRAWSALEDAKLVDSLVNMVYDGKYKADNGFKSGYLQHLEQALKEALPNSGILGKPHVESRIKTMKKDWQVVHDMVYGTNTSGFGWDSEKNCVVAEPPIWEAYLAVHKEAAKWKNRTFPHFGELCIVFGKDRANGCRVRDAMEMQDGSKDGSMEDQINLSDDQDDASNAHTNMQSQECTSGSKKRKIKSESLHEVINNATFVLGDKLMKASQSLMEVEVEMLKKTSMIADELEKFGSFSETEMFSALRKITKDSESVITFWSLKEGRRENWVRFMLET